MEIRVSIIVPIYNVENYLRECLDSLANQTMKDLQVILVIDGSTDSSEMIAREYVQQYDNFEIIVQENRGLSGARNTGLREARGQYIYFVDSDDYISLEAMEELYEYAEKNQSDVVLFDADVFMDGIEKYDYTRMEPKDYYDRSNKYDVTMTGPEMFCRLYRDQAYRPPVWIQFYRTDFLLKNQLTFLEGIIHEDELFTFRILQYAERAIHYKKKYFHRRLRKNSIMTGTKSNAQFIGLYTVVNAIVSEFPEENMSETMKEVFQQYIADYVVILLNRYADLSRPDRKKYGNELAIIQKYARKTQFTSYLCKLLQISVPLYKIVRTIKRKICCQEKV